MIVIVFWSHFIFAIYHYLRINAKNQIDVDLWQCMGTELDYYPHRIVQLAILIFWMLLTVAELAIYMSIFQFIYVHDQSMRSLLPAATIKQRNRRNLISLTGHIVHFGLEFIITFTITVANLIVDIQLGFVGFFLWMCQSGVIAIVMIALSDELKNEMMGLARFFYDHLVYPLMPKSSFFNPYSSGTQSVPIRLYRPQSLPAPQLELEKSSHWKTI